MLTHEIMNSAIPISTLSSVISQMLQDEEGKPLSIAQLNNDVGQDVLGGLKTIESRSKGLVRFVDAYKSLTKITTPKFEEIKLMDLVRGVESLMNADTNAIKIKWITKIDEDQNIKGDKELLEQVLINLVKNAIEAVEGVTKARIEIKSEEDLSERVVLSISDNGPGISHENLENIFIPFF